MATHPTFDLLIRYGSVAALREAMKSDAELRAEVGAELASVLRIDERRCVVTKEYRDALEEALR